MKPLLFANAAVNGDAGSSLQPLSLQPLTLPPAGVPRLAAAAALSSLVMCAVEAAEGTNPLTEPRQKLSDKKIIEMSFAPRTTKNFRSVADHSSNSQLFDGSVLNLQGHDGQRYFRVADRAFGKTPLPLTVPRAGTDPAKLSELEQGLLRLEQLDVKKLKFPETYVRLNARPADFDWFSDKEFGVVRQNVGGLVKVAAASTVRGIFFDLETESGPGDRWCFSSASVLKAGSGGLLGRDGEVPLDALKAKVEARGRELMERIQKEVRESHHQKPFHLLFSFGPDESLANKQGKYDLLPAFFSGLVKANDPKLVRIIDGHEPSYSSRTETDFRRDRESALKRGASLCQMPVEDYVDKVWVAFPVRMEQMSPQQFRTTLDAALKVSDYGVWIYTQDVPATARPAPSSDAKGSAGGKTADWKIDWWEKKDAPPGYSSFITPYTSVLKSVRAALRAPTEKR